MRAKHIKVGGHYLAAVNGRFVTVRVDRIETGLTRDRSPRYHVTNLATGRKTTFRSAQKFRREATPAQVHGDRGKSHKPQAPKKAKPSADVLAADDAKNRTPDAGLDAGEREDQPEEATPGPFVEESLAAARKVRKLPGTPPPATGGATPGATAASTPRRRRGSPGGRPSTPTTSPAASAPPSSPAAAAAPPAGRKPVRCPGCGKPCWPDALLGGRCNVCRDGGPEPESTDTQEIERLEAAVRQGAGVPPAVFRGEGGNLVPNKDEHPAAVRQGGEQRPDPTSGTTTASRSSPATNGRTSAGAAATSSRTASAASSGLAARLAGEGRPRPEQGGSRHGPGDNAPHVEVQALAGTGKTTTVIEGLKAAKGLAPAVHPSDQQRAVWDQLAAGRHDAVRVSSFSTAITNVLKERVEGTGLNRKGVEARGIHSLGLGAVTKAFGRLEASQYAVRDMVCEMIRPGASFRELNAEAGNAALISAADELVGLCKQTLTDPTEEGLDALCRHYDVEVNGCRDRVYDLVPRVLEKCRTPKGRISFDDMVWLPLVHDLPVYKVDLQIIDESQDLNRMQQQLMYRAGRRIAYVGDEHQAIYGFAGADAESMKRMREELGAGLLDGSGNGAPPGPGLTAYRGCVTLPLTVTRRCGKAIVEEARKIVPAFEAHPDNHLGLVSEAVYPVQKTSGQLTGGVRESREVPWDKSYCAMVRPGDMLLCRVNAPLVSQCFRFLRRGVKANILGRKVGEGLAALVKKSKASSVPGLVGWLGEWLARETAAEEARKYPSEQRLIALGDRHDCLLAFTEGAVTVEDVLRKIEEVFTDDKRSPGVLLSSIHKSKGLESKRVFLLEPEGATVPHPMAKSAWQVAQEWNLRYVAVTRAIEELVYVR